MIQWLRQLTIGQVGFFRSSRWRMHPFPNSGRRTESPTKHPYVLLIVSCLRYTTFIS